MYTKNFVIWIIFLCLFLGSACQHEKTVHLKLSGHRGADFIAPENTLASIDSCIKYQIDFAECDVCISKDSVFYLLHDSLLDRTTNGQGNIQDWMSVDIDTLDAGSWFGDEFRGERVPRLKEVLKRAKDGGIGITIDYRTGDMERLLDLIRGEDMLDRCTFVFSTEEEFKAFRRLAPEVRGIQAYVRFIADFERVVSELKPDIVVIHVDSLTRELIDRSHDLGIKVLALAFNKKNPTISFRKSVRLGVDILGTDRPEYLVREFDLIENKRETIP